MRQTSKGVLSGLRRGNLQKGWCLAVLATCLSGGSGYARKSLETSFVAPFQNFVLRDPRPPQKPGSTPNWYSATSPNSRWEIAQWNIASGRLSPFSKAEQDGTVIFTATSSEDQVKVIHSHAGTGLHLSQDGAVLPCDNPSGHPIESDLLFEPKPRGTPGGSALRVPPVVLSDLQALTISMRISIEGGSLKGRKKCDINQSGSSVSLILNDFKQTPPQTLFYQVNLALFCGPGSPSRVRQCRNTRPSAGWFSKANPFGVDDRFFLARTEPLVLAGKAQNEKLDVLPRIYQLISAGPTGIDRDPSHWVLASSYAGQAVWGDMWIASTWKDFRISLAWKESSIPNARR